MRLDRYSGQEPRFRVQRRQPDGSYIEVDPWDCFVMKRQDVNSTAALYAYAAWAGSSDPELAADIRQLAVEWGSGPQRMPD